MDRRSQGFQAGLLAAVLAATLQFVLWAGVMSGSLGTADPLAAATSASAGALCATGNAAGHDHHAPGSACLLCPVCLALSLPGALPAPPTGPLPPRFAGAAPLPLLHAQAQPPRLALASAYPRGPPLA